MTAKQWLNTEREYNTGLAILEENGISPTLLSILQKGESYYNRTRLLKELQALAQKETPAPKPQTLHNLTQPSPPKPKENNYQLNTRNYPEPLHAAVNRQKELYAAVNHFHPQLDGLYNQNITEAFKMKCFLQDCWEEIKSIWRILTYYQENKQILPNKYGPSEINLPSDRADLERIRRNNMNYINREKRNPKKFAQVKERQQQLQLINKILGYAQA